MLTLGGLIQKIFFFLSRITAYAVPTDIAYIKTKKKEEELINCIKQRGERKKIEKIEE